VALAVVALAGDHIGDVLFAIVLVITPTFIRLVRSQAQVVRNARYVEAAIASGCRPGRVLRVHVLPNLSGIVFAQFALSVASAILVIAALNFLGVGVSPPTPTWGSMIATGAGVIDQGQWWVALFPSIAILVVVVGFNVIARAVEDLTQGRR
jgi:peptide/nickel transport system permease protein